MLFAITLIICLCRNVFNSDYFILKNNLQYLQICRLFSPTIKGALGHLCKEQNTCWGSKVHQIWKLFFRCCLHTNALSTFSNLSLYFINFLWLGFTYRSLLLLVSFLLTCMLWQRIATWQLACSSTHIKQSKRKRCEGKRRIDDDRRIIWARLF